MTNRIRSSTTGNCCLAELGRICATFGELRRFADLESELEDRRAAIARMEEQALQLMSGKTDIRGVGQLASMRVPGREVARRIIEIVSELPAIDAGGDEALRLSIARLYENLVVGLTGVIMRDYPELIPRERVR